MRGLAPVLAVEEEAAAEAGAREGKGQRVVRRQCRFGCGARGRAVPFDNEHVHAMHYRLPAPVADHRHEVALVFRRFRRRGQHSIASASPKSPEQPPLQLSSLKGYSDLY